MAGVNTVFKLMLFSILLNMATGIMMTAIPAFNNPQYTGGLVYNKTYGEEFIIGMNDTIKPTSALEAQSSLIDNILDKLNLGFISRFIKTVDKYMFGFIQVLQGIVGGALGPRLSNIFFGLMRVAISIGYILGALYLWTGKQITK